MALSLQSSNWSTWGFSESALSSPTHIDFSATDATGLLYFVCICATTTINGPAGWTLLPVTTFSSMKMHTFYKYSPTGDPTWTWSGTPGWAWTHGGVWGANPTTPVQQVATGMTGTNTAAITAPTITSTGGSGDWLITLSAHWIPLSGNNTQTYNGLGWGYTGGVGGPPTYITGSGQGNSSLGVHNPKFTRTTLTSPGMTAGGWTTSHNNAATAPSGKGWVSQGFIIRDYTPTSGRRFFMIS